MLPEFLENRHIEVAKLSDLGTNRLYTLADITGTHFCYRLSRPEGHTGSKNRICYISINRTYSF